jgi:hypothetical protein
MESSLPEQVLTAMERIGIGFSSVLNKEPDALRK